MGASELVMLPFMLLFALAPLAVAVWLLITIHRMSRDLADVARAVRSLADRADRADAERRS